MNSNRIKELKETQKGCYAHDNFTYYLFKRLSAHIEFDAFEEHLGKEVLICDLPR